MISLQRYAEFLTRRPWIVLGLVAMLTALVASGIGKLRVHFNLETSLPANHPFVRIDHTIRRQFGGRNTVLVAIVPREGDVWRPEVLEVVRAATMAALRLKDVMGQNVVSLAAPAVRYVEDRGDRIEVEYLMRETPRTAEEIARLRQRVESDPQLRGMLVTPDNRAALLIVDFWDQASGLDLGKEVLTLAEPFRGQPVDFYFTGEPIVALMNEEQSREVGWRIPVTFAVIAAMLLASFRNVQGMFVPMLTATLSTLWGLGLMGHTGIVVDTWNVATPILLIAIAAGHSAQMLKRYTEEVAARGDNRAAVISSTAAIGPVMIAAGSVAALGFASLGLIGVPAITGFGLACAYGIASAVFLEMTFIPALRTLLPPPRNPLPKSVVVERILHVLRFGILYRRGLFVLAGAGAVLLLGAAGVGRIRTYGSTREYMPRDSMARRHLEEIEKHFPGAFTMTILYQGNPGDMERLEVLRHMDGLRAELERNGLVWRTASVVDLVKSLNKTLNPDAQGAYVLPENQETVKQLLFLGASPAFERFVDRSNSKAVLMAYLRDDDSALVGPLVRGAQEWVRQNPAPPGVEVLIAGGAGPTVLAANEHMTYAKIVNIAVILATIYAISSLMMRSPLGGLYVITPIVVAVFLLFGLLGWTGIRLDMGSAAVIAMAAGVGADYAIYFLYRFREERRRAASDAEAMERTLQTSGRAVMFVAGAIGAGFGVMGFSKFLGLHLFGTLMPTAMVLSCLAAISVMPVLILRMRPRFVFEARVLADAVPGEKPRRALLPAGSGVGTGAAEAARDPHP